MKPIEFWFEFASSYTYIAAMQIEEACRDARVPLIWRPFLLGPIFAMQGWDTSHFNLNPLRGNYMWRDMGRLTTKFALPWQRPTEFPRQTTPAARIACSIQDEPWIGAFARAVFVANFGHDRDIGDREVLADIITSLGRDATAVVAHAEQPERRGDLRANTNRAIELGIFGAPNFVIGDELFWGEETIADAIDFATRRS